MLSLRLVSGQRKDAQPICSGRDGGNQLVPRVVAIDRHANLIPCAVAGPLTCSVSPQLRNGYERDRHAQQVAAVGDGTRDPPTASAGPLDIRIRVASSSAEYRAASYLRAACFYTYPEERSEFAAQAHQRMKADQEWQELEEKVAGTCQGFQGIQVTCMVAVVPDDERSMSPEVRQALVQEVAPSALTVPSMASGGAEVVVGSLDINQGQRLPSEELIGSLPVEGVTSKRAYLSNVCVASAMRKQGVATALMSRAIAISAAIGVTDLYVHVVAENVAAVALYRGVGFEVEAEESVCFAHDNNRPRRLLLHLGIQA